MLLGIPLAIWLGILTISLLSITLSMGIAMVHFQKNVFKYHKFFAYLTIGVAAIHAVTAALLWFFGVLI